MNLARVLCRLLSHNWKTYFVQHFPSNDDEHWEKECQRCGEKRRASEGPVLHVKEPEEKVTGLGGFRIDHEN